MRGGRKLDLGMDDGGSHLMAGGVQDPESGDLVGEWGDFPVATLGPLLVERHSKLRAPMIQEWKQARCSESKMQRREATKSQGSRASHTLPPIIFSSHITRTGR